MNILITIKRFVLFFYGLLEIILLFFLRYSSADVNKRRTLTVDLSKKFISRMGIKQRVYGVLEDKNNGYLYISNHISWLDMIGILGEVPLRFIAKREVKKFPIIGYIATCLNVIFISRDKKSDTSTRVKEVSNVLAAGDNVMLYPEGTTSDGTLILPFKISFFQAAIDAQTKIAPVVIRYVNSDGSINTNIAYWKDINLIQSIWYVAKQRGVTLEIHVLEPITISAGLNRIEVATMAGEKMQQKFAEINSATVTECDCSPP